MSIIRAAYRSVAFFISTVFLYSVYAGGCIFCRLFGNKITPFRNWIVRIWAKTTALIIGMKLTIKGAPPEPPFLMVSNHLSYVDIISYFIALDCVFVAKNDIKSWPILGYMARKINIIFLDRTLKRDIPRVNRLIEENITDNQGIVFFPEGTTTKGQNVNNFKASLLKHAADRQFPVSYASITYRTLDIDKPAHEWVCWWGDMTFLDHFFKLVSLKSFESEVTFGNKKIQDSDRKKLAAKLQKMVKKQFIPTINQEQLYV